MVSRRNYCFSMTMTMSVSLTLPWDVHGNCIEFPIGPPWSVQRNCYVLVSETWKCSIVGGIPIHDVSNRSHVVNTHLGKSSHLLGVEKGSSTTLTVAQKGPRGTKGANGCVNRLFLLLFDVSFVCVTVGSFMIIRVCCSCKHPV